MNALTSTALLASTSISTPSDGDAELIRVCDAHAAKIDAVNNGDEKSDNSPAWQAYSASVDFINVTKATALAGLLAKARAAKAEAVTYDSSGEEHWQNCPAENWRRTSATNC